MAVTVEEVDKKSCTGCGACFSLCPTGAINMRADNEGFLYPEISKDKCTSCGLCYIKCPAENHIYSLLKNGDIYAVCADDEIRMRSSSGGMFTVLAKYAFSKGGAVVGAAWTVDRKVQHIVIRDESGLDKLRRSKYLQSDTADTFIQTKALLEQNTFVLYSGSPCQIAGLYSYLGKEYDNLLTADIVCHGVPSPLAFKNYLKEISGGKEVTEVNFRDKSRGWTTPSSAEFADGTKYYKSCNEDPYYIAFLNGISTRLSCGSCAYASPERIGDITLGDFWGVSEIDPSYSDNKGTSLVMLNSQKGKSIFEEIKSELKLAENVSRERTLEIAKRRNGQLLAPRSSHKNREKFFGLLDKGDFSSAVFEAAEKKYDVGVVGWWYNENYGGTLTYYALNQVLKSMGLSVLMIEKANNVPDQAPDYTTVPRRFAKKYYNISKVYPAGKMGMLNELCSAFVSGSDQLFNPSLWAYSGPQYFMDFAALEKKIISYASSFGNTLVCSDKHKMLMSYYLRRFDALSVREDYAVKIMDNNFGLEAKKVLDPVFVCDPAEYERLAGYSSVDVKDKYFVNFILDPDKQKRELVLYAGKQLELPYINLLNAIDFEENSKKLDLDNTVTDIDIEDFLKYYKNAEFIITDSFHGTCFAIIFRKPFISIANKKRGAGRFVSMLTELGLQERMADSIDDIYKRPELFKEVDYTETEKRLGVLRRDSYEWLKQAILAPTEKPKSEFHVFDANVNRLVNTVSSLTAEVKELRQLVSAYAQPQVEEKPSIFKRAIRKARRMMKK